MKSPAQFSICIPNYNYSGYIGKTIDSVLAQHYQNFEVIVVDNASTDNSWEVIQEYVQKDNRIKAYRNEYNIGFAPNLDKVVGYSNNPYIITLSSDDLMKENALEEYARIISALNEDEAKNIMICSAIDIIDENGIKTGEEHKAAFHNIPTQDHFKTKIPSETITDYEGIKMFQEIFYKFSVPGPFCSTMFTKHLYNKVSGYGSVNLIGPDAHFAYKILLNDARVIFVDDCLFAYRVHSNAQLGQVSKNKNINVLIDRYIFSNYYSKEQLSKARLNKEDYIKTTIREDCVKGGLLCLANGELGYGLRHLFFAMAAYPRTCWRTKSFYLLLSSMLLFPISMSLLYVVKKIKSKP